MNVKGSALRARVQFARDQGPEQYQRFFEALSPPARELIEEGFLPNQWYPYEIFCELTEVLDRELGEGDGSLIVEVGRYACDANLPAFYRLFFKMGNVGYIIGKAETAWKVTYDFGSIRVIDRDPGEVTLRIEGVVEPRRAHCLSILGWCVRAGEISGARNTRWEERCRTLGDEVCELRVCWD